MTKKRKSFVWYCPICKVGVVSITPMFNRHRYGCNNCLALYFADGKKDKRVKPLDKVAWLKEAQLPTIEEVKELVRLRS